MLLTIITFFITLSILILAHELGHYLVAKKAGIKVEEFGFGYPPRILAKKVGETIWSINAIPFGGFVRLYGEDLPHSAKASRGNEFWSKSKKARTAVILAGVLANFLLAIICFSIVYSVMGIPTKTNQVSVAGVAPNSPAQTAGLKENDLILAVDRDQVVGLEHFMNLIDKRKGQTVVLEIRRGDQIQKYTLIPRNQPPENEGPLGVAVVDTQMVKYSFWQMPFRGAVEGIKEALAWGSLIIGSLKKMVTDLVFYQMVPKDVAGPIGIFQASGNVAKQGILTVLQFIGILSINLGIINILPLPALDGGKLVFIAYEAITGKKPRPKYERWAGMIGMAFLLTLMLLITINDVVRIIKK